MRYRMLAVAIAAAGLSAGPAGAQTGSTGGAAQSGMSQAGRMTLDLGSLNPISEYETTVTYNGKSVEDLKSADVKGANDEKIGRVDKVLADETSKVVAVTVEAGGYLGTGEKEVVLPIDRLQYDANAKTFTTKLSKDEVKSLPEWRR